MSASASEPAVVARPAVSMLSFTSTGMPCSGPRDRPLGGLGIEPRGVVEGVGVERADGVDQRVDGLDPVEGGVDERRLAVSGGVMASILALEGDRARFGRLCAPLVTLCGRVYGALTRAFGPFTQAADQRTHRSTPEPSKRHCSVANIKSQIKRIKQNNAAHERNKSVKSALKTSIRRFREALSGRQGRGRRARQSRRPQARQGRVRRCHPQEPGGEQEVGHRQEGCFSLDRTRRGRDASSPSTG